MKRTILKKLTACLCLCAVLSGALTVPAGAASFQDVPSNHWAATAIDRCAAQGWFQGKTADTFGVGQPMTRAGFAVALSRFFGWQSGETYYRIFSDVPQGAWYEPALRACYEHGAVTRQTGDFRPGDPITREELAVMLIRALGYGPIAGLAEDDPLPFRDVTTNKGHIAMAYELGLVSGMGNDLFVPDRYATREQAAVMLSRLYDKLHPAQTANEAMVLLRSGEEAEDLSGYQTVILTAGTLTGGQNPRLALSVSNTQKQVMETATASGQTVLLGISDQSGVLKSTAAAATAVAEALTDSSYDGVYLNITPSAENGDALAAFVQALRAAVPEKKLYVAASAPARREAIPDYQALGKAADRIVLQVSGHEDTDGAVPVYAMEPLETVYYALSALNDQIPGEKLALLLTAEGHGRKGTGKPTAFKTLWPHWKPKAAPTILTATPAPIWRQRIRWSGISTKRRWKPASSCCAASAYPPAVSPPPTVLCKPKKAELSNPDRKNRLAFQQGGFLLFNYRYFRIPSVAVSTSPLMVTVNLMLFRSPNTSSQLRNFSVSASTSAPTVLHRLSMNT